MKTLDAGSGHDGAGHRARLRQKLADSGGEALHDHELIEYLLALAIPGGTPSRWQRRYCANLAASAA